MTAFWLASAHAAITVVGCLVAVFLGGRLVTVVFRAVDHSERRPRSLAQAGELLRGGAWIGYLERLTVYAALMSAYPEGIAIALAVKGLARYPDLKGDESHAASERFIIGTFTSVLWACACAGLARWANHLL